MFAIIRIVIGALGLVLSQGAINLMKCRSKRYIRIFVLIFWIATVSISAFIPIENYFARFESAEKVYDYMYYDNSKFTVSGKECDMVVGGNDQNKLLIVPKDDKGWKIGIGINTKQVAQVYKNDILVCVYNFKGTTDYFLYVFNPAGEEVSISDKFDSTFFAQSRVVSGEEYIDYYACINDFDEEYWVFINDEHFFLN